MGGGKKKKRYIGGERKGFFLLAHAESDHIVSDKGKKCGDADANDAHESAQNIARHATKKKNTAGGI